MHGSVSCFPCASKNICLAAFLQGPRCQRERRTPTENICHRTPGEKPASSTGPQPGKTTCPRWQSAVEAAPASSSGPCAIFLSEHCWARPARPEHAHTPQAPAEVNSRATRGRLSWATRGRLSWPFTRQATGTAREEANPRSPAVPPQRHPPPPAPRWRRAAPAAGRGGAAGTGASGGSRTVGRGRHLAVSGAAARPRAPLREAAGGSAVRRRGEPAAPGERGRPLRGAELFPRT